MRARLKLLSEVQPARASLGYSGGIGMWSTRDCDGTSALGNGEPQSSRTGLYERYYTL